MTTFKPMIGTVENGVWESRVIGVALFLMVPADMCSITMC